MNSNYANTRVRAPSQPSRSNRNRNRRRQRQANRRNYAIEFHSYNPAFDPSYNPAILQMYNSPLTGPQGRNNIQQQQQRQNFDNLLLPVVSNQNRQQDAAMIGIENEEDFQRVWNKYIEDFYKFEIVFLFVLVTIFILTQIFNKSMNAVVITFQAVASLYLLVYFAKYLVAQTVQDKTRYTYHILETILYLAFLFNVQDSTLFGGDHKTYNGVTFLLGLNLFLRILFGYVQQKAAIWKFIRQLNKQELLVKFLLLTQATLIILRYDSDPQTNWIVSLIPLQLVALIFIAHIVSLSKKLFSPTGKLLFSPLNKTKALGLGCVYGIPFGFVVCLVLCLVEDWTLQSKHIFAALLTVIGINLIFLVYTRYYKNEILLIGKYMVCLYDTDPANQERVVSFVKRMQEEQKKIEEDKIQPEFLLKASNSYFKLLDSSQLKSLRKDIKKVKKSSVSASDKAVVNSNDVIIEIPGDNQALDQPQVADIEAGDQGKCVICFDSEADAVCLPCGHGGICFVCAQELVKVKRECHFCRSEIRRLIQIEPQEINNNYVKVKNISKIDSSRQI